MSRTPGPWTYDPNDEDDFKIGVAYIEERMHSITSFTDANRMDKSIYWLGRDPVYLQVIDSNANVDPCCPEQVHRVPAQPLERLVHPLGIGERPRAAQVIGAASFSN